MKPTPLFVLFALLILSCAPLKKAQLTKTDAPALGVLGKDDKSLINKNFQQVGRPVFSNPIAISVNEVPFTKSQYKTYSNLKAQRGEKPAVQYIDSLLIKPKYYRLEIKDKIGLKTLLNGSENSEVRSYLTRDKECKIVSGISFYIHEMEAEFTANSKDLFLTTDDMGVLRIERINGNKRQVVRVPENEIFTYELMGFCWGEDIYGSAKIEMLNEGGNCPDGTEKNARKLDDVKSYLKL